MPGYQHSKRSWRRCRREIVRVNSAWSLLLYEAVQSRDKVILDIYTIDNIGPECARLTKILRDDVCFYSS